MCVFLESFVGGQKLGGSNGHPMCDIYTLLPGKFPSTTVSETVTPGTVENDGQGSDTTTYKSVRGGDFRVVVGDSIQDDGMTLKVFPGSGNTLGSGVGKRI